MNEVMHFTYDPKMVGIHEVKVSENDNSYGITKAEIVRQYLKTAYSGEEKQAEIEAFEKKYKVLKRNDVTTFYDVDGNTLFDVENARLQSEYEWLIQQEETGGAAKCFTGKSKSGLCGAAAYCSTDNKCCAECTDPCSSRCGWLDEPEKEEEKVDENAAEKVDTDIDEAESSSESTAPVAEKPAEQQGDDGEVRGGIEDAVKKLQSELSKASDKYFAEPVLNHIIERVRESESLAKDVLQQHKTWDKCYQYIKDQARKVIKGSAGGVRDSVVYEWAEDYFHLDDKAAEEKKAKEAAERKKKEDERKQKEKEKAKSAKKSPDKKPVPASNNQSGEGTGDSPSPVAEPKPQHKPKKNEMDGQMDLFSLMGM